MNKNFHKGIKEITSIKMTHAEKQAMLACITSSTITMNDGSMGKSVKSPWSVYSFGAWIKRNQWSYVVMVILIMFGVGGGLASASMGTLPGSILYPFKVSILEPLKSKLVTSPLAQAVYQATLATERLQEAETLAAQGSLDLPKQQQLSALLTEHTVALGAALDAGNSDTATSSMEIKRDFKANMTAHAKLLDTIATDNVVSENKDISSIAEKARKSGDSVNVVVPPLLNTISAVTTSASPATTTESTFNKHKKTVETLIDQTRSDVSNAGTSTDKLGQAIASSTIEGLNQAQQALDNADKHNNQGDREGARQSLMQSEQSAKEATIYFRAGLNIQKDKGNKQ